MRIEVDGKIGIGTTTPKGKLSIQSNGSVPASIWVTSGVPIFAGFGENTAGNADQILGMASNTPSARPVFLGRKSRGTLNFPTAVQNNDYILSIFASAYDGGGTFQSPATLDFFVDGTVSSGKVPTRVSISTGSSFSDRTERLKVGSTGDINFNNGQLFVKQSTGHVGIGIVDPGYGLAVTDANYGLYSYGTYYGAIGSADGNAGDGVSGYGYIGLFGSGKKYGVYAYSTGSGGYAGYFGGPVYTTGTYQSSDQKLKQNIEDAPSALGIIGQLKPKRYEYRQDGAFKAMNLPTGQHYGFIAQDVEKILPDLVKSSTSEVIKAPPPAAVGSDNKTKAQQTSMSEKIDFKAVNYTELIPILVKAVQEQQEQIHNQDSVIQNQQSQINDLQTLVKTLSGGQTVNAKTATLGQNTPNPGTNGTRIAYSIPDAARHAQLVLFNQAGARLQVVQVTGSGNINLSTTGLASGVYHYSLIVDNAIVDTKQMVIAR